MRKVVYGINISIDGCVDHTAFNPSENVYDYFINLLSNADQIIYGRKTYELMFPYWSDILSDPTATKDELSFAETITAIDKMVFSKTLDSVKDNTRIMRDNLEEEILRLKQLPGKDISIGGVDLSSQIMALGLVDEYHFLVHPILVGKGVHLFEYAGLNENINIELVNVKTFKSGCLALQYAKK